jgi:hypothetical protein
VSHRRRTTLGAIACVAGLGLFGAPAAAAPPTPPPPADGDAPAAAPSEPAASENTLVLTRVLPLDDQITARLHAELGVSGLEGLAIEVGDDVPMLGLELLDRVAAADAGAAIEIVVARNRIDICVADANTGKTISRRFDLILDPGLAEPRAIAIAAVELLRTSRLELADVTPPGDDEPPPSEQVTEDELPPEDVEKPVELPLRAALSLAPVLGGGPGGLGLTAQLEVAARWVPTRRFALRTSLWIPTLGNRVVGELGQARVLPLLLFIEPQLRLPGGAPWFHPELGLGLGLALTVIQGQPNAGSSAASPVLPGFATHAHVGLGFELSRRVWFRIDGYVGIVQPQPQVVFVDEVVAKWGLPFATGSIGVEVWF